jgi:hypothetical protein
MAGKDLADTCGKGDPPKEAWSTRLSEHTREAVQAWAEKQPDKPSLSEAIRRLVEDGVMD